jgi:hypothetical protein
MLTQMLNYDKNLPFIFRLVAKRSEDEVESQLLVTSSPFGYRRMAELIRPENEMPCAAILYVHWYEPESPDSNRSQFVREAREMAKRGTACLLIETIWSDPDFFVIMAATPRFPDWYLYAPKLEGEAREAFTRQMAEIDPITHIGNLSPASILFQFSNDDFHVPRERAEEFFSTAREPKEMRWYQAGHGLNEEATQERIAWLTSALSLKEK